MQKTLPFVKYFSKDNSKKSNETLLADIRKTQMEIDLAFSNFDQAVDPAIIDSCIFELNAAQMRYKYLLTKAKSFGLSQLQTESLVFPKSTSLL